MTEIIEVPGSIEGKRILIKGLKIIPEGRPKKIDNLLVFPLTIKRRGSGIIKKELFPKEYKIQEASLLDIDDSISGKNLWGFSSNLITSGQIQKGGISRTGGHTGQNITISGTCCYLELIHGFRGLPCTIHPKVSFFA